LLEFDKDLESLAQQYASRLIMLQAKKDLDSDNSEYKEVDINTIENMDSKDIGCEHIIYETIKELDLHRKLKDLGFTNVQLNSAIGTIVAKMTNPSSDIKTYRHLCTKSAINELLGCDFNKISSSNIYRVADKLYENKDFLEKHLYEKQKQIFEYDETITLYDLTNTYFEGGAKGIPKAKRGRSKEKRSDAPIITLAVMLDSSGFIRKSEIFSGNIGEPTTFIGMLDKLAVPRRDKNESLFHKKGSVKKSLVVMDAGIASQKNIDYLVEKEKILSQRKLRKSKLILLKKMQPKPKKNTMVNLSRN
jgi:hypothetical protein